MSRRVAIGTFPDGSFQLQTSLAGYDALFADHNDPAKISFSTRWQDRLALHQVGLAFISATFAIPQQIFWPDLGYTPFMEIRPAGANVAFDDQASPQSTSIGGLVRNRSFACSKINGGAPSSGTVFYIVYRYPAPFNSAP